jgi:F0F1-type ATP synthase membrane subunit a
MDRIRQFLTEQLPAWIVFIRQSRWEPIAQASPLMVGVIVQWLIILAIISIVRFAPNSKIGTILSMFFDTMYEFFEEILGEKEKRGIKIYIVTLFFVILVANILWYTIDLLRVIFTDIEAIFVYIQIPTTSFNFNLALALVSILLMLALQFKSLNIVKFVLEYIPITGKGILDIERGTMPMWQYYPAKGVVKIFDIAISLFVWFLDIVGIFAKVLSLTARLYGNMLAWWILLWLLVVWVNSFTQNIASADFPVLAPLVLYAQWLLVTVIQAFVFPLLVAIFIKIAQGNE